MMVTDVISEALRDWGEHPCFLELRSGHVIASTSAEQCYIRVEEISEQLKAWGIRKRYLVPMFLENSTDFIYIFLALLRLGAVPLLVKMDYRRLELEEIFQNAQPQAVISEKKHLEVLNPFLNGRMILIAHSEDNFRLFQSGDCLPSREDLPEDLASINYTYRGYGYPLGAMISQHQYLEGANLLQSVLRAQKSERMLVLLPMAHIFTLVGCILAPLIHRMTSAITYTLHPRYLFEYIKEMKIEHITSVPEIYEMLCRVREQAADLSSLKTFVSGGSLLTKESYLNIRTAFSIDMLHGYGLTEFTPISGNIRGQARAGTVGPVCHGIDYRIETEYGNSMGEILIRTPHASREYYRRQMESREAHQNGWFHTGDMGYFDAGHLVFVREIKKTRKINGNIVDLEEVARAIKYDTEITEVHLEWKDNSLYTRLGISSKIDFQEKIEKLKVLLHDLIAGYKIPKYIARL